MKKIFYGRKRAKFSNFKLFKKMNVISNNFKWLNEFLVFQTFSNTFKLFQTPLSIGVLEIGGINHGKNNSNYAGRWLGYD
jgi:hypothetical protein